MMVINMSALTSEEDGRVLSNCADWDIQIGDDFRVRKGSQRVELWYGAV